MIELQPFREKVYGNLALTYHRTESVDIAKGILEKGFIPGAGAMYGEGLYTTYDLESQLGGKMDHYGDVIVKFKVALHKFLIFDYDIAKIVYGKDYTLSDQVKIIDPLLGKEVWNKIDNNDSFNNRGFLRVKVNNKFYKIGKGTVTSSFFIPSDKKLENLIHRIKEDLHRLKSTEAAYVSETFLTNIEEYKKNKDEYRSIVLSDGNYLAISANWDIYYSPVYKPLESIERAESIMEDTTPYTSDAAGYLVGEKNPILDKANGLIFTGRKDGRVAVVYNYSAVTPLSYYIDSEYSGKGQIQVEYDASVDPISGKDWVALASKNATSQTVLGSFTPVRVYEVDSGFTGFAYIAGKGLDIVWYRLEKASYEVHVYQESLKIDLIISFPNGRGVVINYDKNGQLISDPLTEFFPDNKKFIWKNANRDNSKTWIPIKSPQATQRAFKALMKTYHS